MKVVKKETRNQVMDANIVYLYIAGDEFPALSEEEPQLSVRLFRLLLSGPGPGLAPQARSELGQLGVRSLSGHQWLSGGWSPQADGGGLALQLRPPAASADTAGPRELRHSTQPGAPGQSFFCVLCFNHCTQRYNSSKYKSKVT